MADQADEKDEKAALAADGEDDDTLVALSEGAMGGSGGRRATPRSPEEPGFTPGDEQDDDAPAPETGLHALGQLGTAVLVVSVLIAIFLVVAIAFGWIFR